MGAGPMGGTHDGGRAAAAAAQRLRLDLAVRDGWHIRYDGAHDEFVAARDQVSASSLDGLLIEMLRAQRADPDED